MSSLPFDCGININETIFLKGISGKIVSTLDTAEISIFGYPSKFQIVTDDFPIPCEGLLGTENFENSHAILDFEHQCMRVGKKCFVFKERQPVTRKNRENEGKIFIPKTEEEEARRKNEMNQHLYEKREGNTLEVWEDKISLGYC